MHRARRKKKPDTDGTMVSPSIGSASDPISQVFHPRDLPKELMVGIDVEKELRDSAQVDMAEVMMTWMTHKYPTLTQKQDCEDVISMHSDNYDQRTKEEIHLGGKLALIAYAFPFAYQRISVGFHQKNSQFSRFLESFMVESIFMTYKNMVRAHIHSQNHVISFYRTIFSRVVNAAWCCPSMRRSLVFSYAPRSGYGTKSCTESIRFRRGSAVPNC